MHANTPPNLKMEAVMFLGNAGTHLPDYNTVITQKKYEPSLL
jgi:hypothetical protein